MPRVHLRLIVLPFIFSSLAFAAEPEMKTNPPTATIIRMAVTNPLPDDLAEKAFFSDGWSTPGIEWTFVVAGKNLVRAKKNSLRMTAADAKGKNIIKPEDRGPWGLISPEPSVRQGYGSCSDPDEGGVSTVTFDAKIATAAGRRLARFADDLTADGSIVMFVASGAKKCVKQGLKSGDAFTEGDMVFGVDRKEKDGEKKIAITLKNPLSLAGRITVMAGTKEAHFSWASLGEVEQTWEFDDEPGPISVQFSVWQGIKEVTVPLHYGKKK